MKKILITGSGSYIGESFKEYLKNFGEEYSTDTLDMQRADWREHDFSGYDVVYHVAGIAHRKETSENAHLYYEVNRDLALEVAHKAKSEGVSQLIFLSSMSVYGIERGVITPDTPLAPKSNYGRSKMEAEEGMTELASEDFAICTLRPPMVYGKGCKGNYTTLSTLAKKLPCFPYVDNKRSMLYIENLVEFVKLMVDNEEHGIFWPQNSEYTNTSQMVAMIAAVHGKRMILVKGFSWALKILSRMTALVDKAFGSFCCDQEMSSYKQNYCIVNLADSIKETEGIQ